MRRSPVAVLLLFGARGVVSQFGGSSGPPACVETCLSNQTSSAANYGCASSNTTCLCNNAQFTSALSNCTNSACASEGIPASILSLGQAEYCSGFAGGGSSTSRIESATSSALSVTSATQSSTLAASSQTSSASPLSAVSTPTSSSSPATSTSSQGLSVGAKAGIAIGAIVGFLILCALIYIAYLLRRQHNSKKPQTDEAQEEAAPKADEQRPHALAETETNEKHELGAREPRELDGGSKPTEMDSMRGWDEPVKVNPYKQERAELQG